MLKALRGDIDDRRASLERVEAGNEDMLNRRKCKEHPVFHDVGPLTGASFCLVCTRLFCLHRPFFQECDNHHHAVVHGIIQPHWGIIISCESFFPPQTGAVLHVNLLIYLPGCAL
ncbi:hypothetical protein AOLI_G00247020 [Acnodon oligacanthus]